MSPRQCGLFVHGDSQFQRRAPLKSINVNATTCGPIAHNTIKFHYKNTSDAAIQSKFIFPVNSLSCIYHLSAIVGGRKIIGNVKDKEEAQKDYNQAVESGKSAVLAKESKEASDIMELELGAFGSNEEAEITIKEGFEMKLVNNGQQFQYKFPTSLFIRYGDSITSEASQNPSAEYVLNFNIHSSAGVIRIIPKPWLGNETLGNTFNFMDNRRVFEKDQDVVLDLILSDVFKGVKLTENWQDMSILNPSDRKTEKMLMLSSVLVHVPTTPIAELPAKEYVFVVDCSGSMDGDRIECAKRTLQLLINSLPVGSYFNIVRFGSVYDSLFRQPKEYTKENKEIAMKLAGTMAADLGGTEMHACLKSILECSRQITNYKRQIFVLTDGDISNQDETLSLVKRHAHENRCFSFGIGSGCSTALVNGLADAGIGCASFITDKSAFEWEKRENLSNICIKSLMASASQHIAAVNISPKPRAPKKLPSVIVDSTFLNVFHEGFPDEITFELTLANNQEEHVFSKQNMADIETIESPFEPNVLHKLAAKKIIGEMVTSNLGGSCEEKRKEIVDLSVKEQILSPYTALVGVVDKATITGVSQRIDVGISLDIISNVRKLMATGSSSSAHGSKKRREKKCLREKRRSCGVVIMPVEPNETAASGDNDECKLLPSSKSDEITTYDFITNQQNPGGEWEMKVKSKHEANLFKSIEATFDDIIVQSTMYAILLLLVDFSESFDEWKLAACKGIAFLKKSTPHLKGKMLKLMNDSNLDVQDDMLCQLLD